MVVNLKLLFFTLISLSVFNVNADTDSSIDKIVILKELQSNIAESTYQLSEKIKSCEKNQSDISHVIDIDSLATSKMDKKHIILGLSHLHFKNNFQCVSEEKMNLAFMLGTLRTVKTEYKLDTKEISEVELNLIYPSVKEIELANKYTKLPLNVRNYLENKVGTLPFKLMETLKKSNILM